MRFFVRCPLYILRLTRSRLLRIPHIRRFRFASKGLAVAPGRILDRTDPWTDALVNLSNRGRDVGKQVCLHTHFNHPNEISWITKAAARYLFKKGVIVRNQSVLLKGINDSEQVMERLIKALANMNIQPVSRFREPQDSGCLHAKLHVLDNL